MNARIAVALLALGLTAQVASAQLIGDKDCFGRLFGQPAVCAATYSLPAVGSNGRSLAEQLGTDGSEQTDVYSTLFSPYPETFKLQWLLLAPITSGQITYRSFGLQSNVFGAFSTSFNGLVESGFVNFEDGPYAVATRTYVLSDGAVARANAAGRLEVHLARNASRDAVAFDYFELESVSAVVPEPSTWLLMGTGLLALGGASRRRSRAMTSRARVAQSGA